MCMLVPHTRMLVKHMCVFIFMQVHMLLCTQIFVIPTQIHVSKMSQGVIEGQFCELL